MREYYGLLVVQYTKKQFSMNAKAVVIAFWEVM